MCLTGEAASTQTCASLRSERARATYCSLGRNEAPRAAIDLDDSSNIRVTVISLRI